VLGSWLSVRLSIAAKMSAPRTSAFATVRSQRLKPGARVTVVDPVVLRVLDTIQSLKNAARTLARIPSLGAVQSTRNVP
jgi:hypothetical protein